MSNIATTKLKRIFKLQYFLELLLETDYFGRLWDESPEKIGDVATIKTHKHDNKKKKG